MFGDHEEIAYKLYELRRENTELKALLTNWVQRGFNSTSEQAKLVKDTLKALGEKV